MEITLAQLKKVIPTNQRVESWHAALSKFLPEYDIDSPKRISSFLAQCSHESREFTTLKENLNYKADRLVVVFPKYFPTLAIAQKYTSLPNKQEAIANRVYANRMGNGDEASGDGYKYSGKGIIQITGKNNYSAFAKSVGMDLDDVPEYLLTCDGAVESACWFWKTNSLNKLADNGDIKGMTKVINGGFNGLDERTKLYQQIIKIIQSS
jgi:putative chitinase